MAGLIMEDLSSTNFVQDSINPHLKSSLYKDSPLNIGLPITPQAEYIALMLLSLYFFHC